MSEYTMMSLRDLAYVVRNNSDMYIVTDLKEWKWHGPHSTWFWKTFVSTVKEVDVAVLDRVVPMLNRCDAYDSVDDAYPWTLMGFDFYQLPTKCSQYTKIIRKSGFRVKVVTLEVESGMRAQGLIRSMRADGLLIFPYTINDLHWMQSNSTKYLFSGYYTDTVLPSADVAASFPPETELFFPELRNRSLTESVVR
jgi:hypothetical protein